MISVQLQRKKYHQSIRNKQLQERFNQARILLRELSPQEAMQVLQSKTKSLQCSILANNIKNIKMSLIQLHNVASQYLIVHFLIRQYRLPIELQSLSHGSFPIQCSWIGILLILLNQYDSELWQECSALLHHLLYQIRKILQNTKVHQYQPQLERILQNFPIHLLLDTSIKVTLNLLDALQQFLQPEQNHEFIMRYLLKPRNFLSVINSLFRHQNMMNDGFQDRVVNISLMVLSVTSKYLFINQEIEFLANFTKELLILKIRKCEISDVLFKKIRALCLSKVSLSKEDIFLLQGILCQQINNSNIPYFHMLATIIHTNQVMLSKKSLRNIFAKLFQQMQHEHELCFRQSLSIVMYQCIQLAKDNIFCGIQLQKIFQQQMYLEWTNQLQVLMSHAKQNKQTLFAVLVEIVWSTWQFMDCPINVYNQRLIFMQQYPEWRILVENSNILQNAQRP